MATLLRPPLRTAELKFVPNCWYCGEYHQGTSTEKKLAACPAVGKNRLEKLPRLISKREAKWHHRISPPSGFSWSHHVHKETQRLINLHLAGYVSCQHSQKEFPPDLWKHPTFQLGRRVALSRAKTTA